MDNLIRGLICDEQVLFTFANTTEIVNEGIRLHKLTPTLATLFGRAMSALSFMSACLKEDAGELSVALRSEESGLDIGASGNRALRLRGYIHAPQAEGSEEELLGENGGFTVVRDDGYNQPFVGACAFPKGGDIDEIFEEYYRISEQLPTRIKTVVEWNERGECTYAGVAVLQPLPFADEGALAYVHGADMQALALCGKTKSIETLAKEYEAQTKTPCERRCAAYRCNCSREYLSGVLVTLGEAQLRDIVATEGAVRVHCHYCNQDYEFTDGDIDRLFSKKV